MKRIHLLIIGLVAIVAIANIIVAQKVKNQRNLLTIDNVTSFVAEGEDGEDGFWFWDEKDAYCTKYVYIQENGFMRKKEVDAIIVNDCVRAFALDCDYIYCPEGWERS